MLARNFVYPRLTKLEIVGNAARELKVYDYYPQMQHVNSLVHYKRVNDAFTMHITKILQGDMSKRISLEATNVVQNYGYSFIQFLKFTYLRVQGFKEHHIDYLNTPLTR